MDLFLFSNPFMLFSIMEFLGDINFILKIFVLMTIIQFVLTHVGKGPVGMVVAGIMTWFIIFDQWKIFGGIYVIYMLLVFGVSHLIVDFIFVSGMAHGGGGGAEATAVEGGGGPSHPSHAPQKHGGAHQAAYGAMRMMRRPPTG